MRVETHVIYCSLIFAMCNQPEIGISISSDVSETFWVDISLPQFHSGSLGDLPIYDYPLLQISVTVSLQYNVSAHLHLQGGMVYIGSKKCWKYNYTARHIILFFFDRGSCF